MFSLLTIMMSFILIAHSADLNMNLRRIKVAAIIEESIHHVRTLEVIELLCRQVSRTELFFETHNLPSHHPALMDGRVEPLLGENVEFILWVVTCETLKFLPPKLQRPVSYPSIFLSVEPCSEAEPVENTGLRHVAIADVIQNLQWSDVNIIFDNSFGGADLFSLMEELSLRFVKFSLYKINTSSADFKEKIFDKFVSVNRNGISRNQFLMILKNETLKEVINSAASLMMTMGKVYWIFVNDNLQPEELVESGVNPRNANMLLFRSTCDGDGKEIRIVNELLSDLQKILPKDNKYIRTLICMVIQTLKSPTSPDLKTLSKCRQHPLDSMGNIMGIFLTSQTPLSNSCYPAFEVATIREGFANSIATTIARWRPDTKLVVKAAFFPNRKYGLGNFTIKVSTVPLSPYVMRLSPEKNSGFQGFAVKILEELSERMNFSFVWREPEDEQFGILINGTFTGLVGQLEKREVDLVVAALTVSYSRSRVIDYAYPYTEEGRALLIKKPIDSSRFDLFKVFRAFNATTWLSFAVVVVVVSLALTIIDGFKRMSDSHNTIRGLPDNRTAKNLCLFSNLSWKETLWSIYTMHLFQVGAHEPTAARSRVIVMYWWLFTILISTYYTANLTAHFTIVAQPSTIENLSNLANDETLVPITLKGSAIYDELKVLNNNEDQWIKNKMSESVDVAMIALDSAEVSDNPVKQAVFKRLKVAPNVYTADQSLPMVKSGKYVFISLWSDVKTMAAQNCEDLMVAGKPYGIRRIAFALPKGSALTAEVSSNDTATKQAANNPHKGSQTSYNNAARASDKVPNDTAVIPDDQRYMGYVVAVPGYDPINATLHSVIPVPGCQGLGIMREAGLIDKWRRFWWQEKASCSNSKDQTPKTLDMQSMGGVYIVFAVFTFVASCLLLLEIFNHKQNKRKRISIDDVRQY